MGRYFRRKNRVTALAVLFIVTVIRCLLSTQSADLLSEKILALDMFSYFFHVDEFGHYCTDD